MNGYFRPLRPVRSPPCPTRIHEFASGRLVTTQPILDQRSHLTLSARLRNIHHFAPARLGFCWLANAFFLSESRRSGKAGRLKSFPLPCPNMSELSQHDP